MVSSMSDANNNMDTLNRFGDEIPTVKNSGLTHWSD